MGIIDSIVEYTSAVQKELDKIEVGDNNGFDPKIVMQLAKDISKLAKGIRDPKNKSLLDEIAIYANGIIGATKDSQKEREFWNPTFQRMSGDFMLRLRTAENDYMGRTR
jgi:hypothetical protein